MPALSAPQNVFLNGLNTKYRAYVGGFGSGKTFVGCLDLLNFFGENPGTRQGYFGSTYPAIRDIFYPTFEEAAEMLGYRVDIKEGNKEIHVYRGRLYYGTVICRSMEKPNTIVGFKISRALVDEIDTLPKKKAKQAWDKIIARMRLKIDGVQNGIGVTTTPEGFMFVYEEFKKDPKPSYSMVQASTYENEIYLPDDYISSLHESYSSQLVEAYINGEFVNLTSGAVYPEFNRTLNHSNETIKAGEPLYVGMDFNVNNMTAVIHVKREGEPIAVDELFGVRDTPTMIDLIIDRFPGHKIYVYPDSSGKNNKSNQAGLTDISQLRSHFTVRCKESNPRVRDRVNNVNAMICNADNHRRYKVNTLKCPNTTDNLEQQVYDQNGEPDKKSDNDHAPDAIGYFLSYDYPIKKPVTKLKVKMA